MGAIGGGKPVVLGQDVALDLNDLFLAHARHMDAGNALAVMRGAGFMMHMVRVFMMVVVVTIVPMVVVPMIVAVMMPVVMVVIVIAMSVIMIVRMPVVMTMVMMEVALRVAHLTLFGSVVDHGIGPASANRTHQITSKSLIFNSSPAVI